MKKSITPQIDVVVKHRCTLAEGPVWDARRRAICWIDIVNGELHEYQPAERKHRKIQVHDMIGCIALCKSGDFIAALQKGFAFINRISGSVKMIADPEAHLPSNRFNDGKCDPAGRFWAGTMSLSEEAKAGSLYVVEKDLSLSKKVEGATIPNGLAWSLDHQIMYYIDTPTCEVAAFDFNKSTGSISNKRIVIQIPEQEGYPDGMTIDSEGMLWIAHWDGWQVTRWNPDTGEKLSSISLPVAQVTSCTFGGDQLQDLYITSAKAGLAEEQLQQQPLAGALFVVRNCGYKGMATFEFDY
jgi:sugar lactone lactonase YvrE